MNTVLVIGSGGREHALAWKLSQSPQVTRIIVAPGNPGMPKEWERWPVVLSEGRSAFQTLAARTREAKVALVIVGPDNPLAEGIVDIFEEMGIRTFGPRASAARIESSKAFAKDIMKTAGVPTAKYWVAETQEEARKIIKSVPWSPGKGWVVKADGLALGKGVKVCQSKLEALEVIEDLMKVSGSLVIEEQLQGDELSWMAFCDGTTCALLEPARDYKRLQDQNQGPNTGGMGAFSPIPGISKEMEEEVRETVFLPTLREMKKRGTEFRGILFAGLMIEPNTKKIWVLEFNARFGDPETQVLMPRINDDLYSWCEATAKGDLSSHPKNVPFHKTAAVVVVAASAGYPENPRKGDILKKGDRLQQGRTEEIQGLQGHSFAKFTTAMDGESSEKTGSLLSQRNAPEGRAMTTVKDRSCAESKSEQGYAPEDRAIPAHFFAGVATTSKKGELATSGGRVLGAMGTGKTVEQARQSAYSSLKEIHFEGMTFRSDIGL